MFANLKMTSSPRVAVALLRSIVRVPSFVRYLDCGLYWLRFVQDAVCRAATSMRNGSCGILPNGCIYV